MTTTNPGNEKTLWINETNGHLYRGDNVDLEDPFIDYDGLFMTAILNQQTITGNTETLLNGWTIVTGSLTGFDPLTGIFTVPDDGIYGMGFFVGITSGANRTEVACHIKDNVSGNTRYISVNLTSDLVQLSPNNWEGAVTFCSTNIFSQGEEMNINTWLNNTETCDFILRIIKIK